MRGRQARAAIIVVVGVLLLSGFVAYRVVADRQLADRVAWLEAHANAAYAGLTAELLRTAYDLSRLEVPGTPGPFPDIEGARIYRAEVGRPAGVSVTYQFTAGLAGVHCMTVILGDAPGAVSVSAHDC